VVADFVPSVDIRFKNLDLLPSAGDADGGWLVDGVRVSADGDSFAQDGPTDLPLTGGARIPKRLGGGFLFFSSRALYATPTFLGRLEPLMTLSTAPEEVHFASSYAVLVANDGGRMVLSLPKKQRMPMPAVGFIDAASLADGRGVMLLEPHRLRVTRDGGKSWSDADVGPILNLVATEDAIWLARASGRPARLEASGTFAEYQRLPDELQRPRRKKFEDPRWPLENDPPLQRAIQRGAPAGKAQAWVEAKGQFFKVDLGSGALLAVTPSVTTTEGECALFPVKNDLVAMCRRSSHSDTIAISGIAGAAPKLEHTFPSASNRFVTNGNGAILFEGPCQERTTPEDSIRICLRDETGRWRELSQRPSTADVRGDGGAPQPLPTVGRFIPNGNGALALITAPKAGLLDLESGSFSEFTKEDYKKKPGVTARSNNPEDFATAMPDGSVVMLVNDGGIRLGRDGSVQHSSQVFSRVEGAGSRALGVDREGKLWQTEDYGQSWTEVDQPVFGRKRGSLSSSFRCSFAGCDFGPWYRLGYPKTAPRNRTLAPAAPTPAAIEGPLPRLTCTSTAPARTKFATRTVDRDGNSTDDYDLGATKFRAPLSLGTFTYPDTSDEVPRATTLLDPALGSGPGQPFLQAMSTARLLRFSEPFAMDGALGTGKFTWQDVFNLSARLGAETDVANPDLGAAVPVLGEAPGTSDGVLAVLQTANGIFLWARGGRSSLLTVGPENRDFSPVAALSKKSGELVLLAEDGDCSARVLEFDPKGRVRALFSLPRRPARRACTANSDSLAVLPDGSIGVVRVPSDNPPTADDPALLFQPGKPAEALAAWSTLAPLEQCVQDTTLARTLFTTSARWIALQHPNADDGAIGVMGALRWGKSRVCAEVLEVGAGDQDVGDRNLELHVLARFAAPASATRRGLGLGGELTENAACKLDKP
jgi:hypothetical protein